MKLILVTQRVEVIAARNERRDALDQRWNKFLERCGYRCVPVPNAPGAVESLADRLEPAGIVLTGGNDLAQYGGDAPERDETENKLLHWAEKNKKPVLGVCRGMQLLLSREGVPLVKVDGHVGDGSGPKLHVVKIDGRDEMVNSYHHWASRSTVHPLKTWAVAEDGVVEAIKHESLPVIAIMWHPERCDPFSESDIKIFKEFFGA